MNAQSTDLAAAGQKSVRLPECGSYGRSGEWCVFQSFPWQEWLAEQMLEKLGFKTFCPRIILGTVSKSKPLERPMFPGYGFVRIDLIRDAWRKIPHLPGIRRLFLTPALRPITIRRQDFQRIMRACLFQRIGDVPVPRPVLKPGTMVRIMSGIAKGQEWPIERMAGPNRVEILLQFLGQTRALQFHVNNLALVD